MTHDASHLSSDRVPATKQSRSAVVQHMPKDQDVHCCTANLQERRQEKAADRERKQEERQKRLEQLEKQLQGLEEGATAAPAGSQAGDEPETGDRNKATGDGAETPGDRSGPEEENDDDDDVDNAEQDGEWSPVCDRIAHACQYTPKSSNHAHRCRQSRAVAIR